MKATRSFSMVGNPNCGKSNLFNRLTGLTQKISNLPGTTVEACSGSFSIDKEKYSIQDLPGIYSLFTKTEDERLVVEHLIGKGANKPDAILFVIDASNLRRNLLLFSQVSELGIPTACVLTMEDTAIRRGIEIKLPELEMALGVPCVFFNPRKEKNTDTVREILKQPRAPKLFGSDTDLLNRLLLYSKGKTIAGLSEETLRRYIDIEKIIKQTTIKHPVGVKSLTLKIDRWVTHKIGGYAIFGIIMMALFQGVFSLATKPMEWITNCFHWISRGIEDILPAGMVSNFITHGLLVGLEGVLVFVPQIFILFFLIGLLEDTGYMVRASFITDRLMQKVGLNGRSIIPMVGGFACAIPSIMATRNIKSKSERLATMLIIPLMSCSARLPVYVLLVSVAIPFKQFWGPFHAQSLVITSAYMSGITLALLLALAFRLLKRKQTQSEFILELPTYQKPRLQTVLQQAWLKCVSFISEAGKVIIVISMILWFLSNFGPSESMKRAKDEGAILSQLDSNHASEICTNLRLEASYAGHLGKFMEPAIEPLGYDWKTGIALITSFAAREVFVGTMATLFQSDKDKPSGIIEKMQAEKNPSTGKPLYGLPYALSLIIFYAFALQCMSTMAVIKRETESWKWPIVLFFAYGLIAYLGAYFVFQLSTLIQ
ncbi:MAG: ferrous iron transporter B [Flavobacteriales bacterium]|nr:ferrous iron transporter B [Flavobacteriaceae bacterium]PHX92318.1 MAG: ferrous iron transporter B [Flavobacteriales bacterium]